MGTDKIFLLPENRKTTHLQSLLIFLGSVMGEVNRRHWASTQKSPAVDHWLNARSVFTAYSGRAVSFSKHKPGIGSLSSMFRLQSWYNCLTYLPSEKEWF